MTKLKIFWIAILLAISFTYGYFVHRSRIFPYEAARSAYHFVRSFHHKPKVKSIPPGRWFPARDSKTPNPNNPEDLEKFAALGYANGGAPASAKIGVTVYDRSVSMKGLNFYTSGHGCEAILMDMEGKELHKWRYDLDRFYPKAKNPKHFGNFFRRAYLYKNGDLLGIYDGTGLIKLNQNSQKIWMLPGSAHHDLQVLDDGTIYVLTREERKDHGLGSAGPIFEDFITLLDPEGKIKRRVSIVKAFQSSVYLPLLERTPVKLDFLHTNALKVLDGRFVSKAPFLKKGNVLVSFREIDTIGIIDMDTEKVVWALSGMFHHQHEPVLLANGNILIFDNNEGANRSKVLEFDILTQQILWSYESNDFYTAVIGSNERLANGNTLITESNAGRVFEVTPDKRIVWEFLNPHRAGEKNELVAVIPELIRLPENFPVDWLQSTK
jgi:hypothetical protein